MTKKEIKNYIEENLKKGYSKEQIKNELLKFYPEKDIIKILIERPEPKLLKQYKIANYFLIAFMVILALLKLLDLTSLFGFLGIFAITFNVLFIIVLIRSRGWIYPILFIIYIVAWFKSLIFSLLTTIFATSLEEYRQLIDPSMTTTEFARFKIMGIILSSLELIIITGVIILSFYCWKKIHPDYKLKHIKHIFTV